MPILLGDHLSLGVSRIPLHGFDIAAGQNQLISYTAVTQTVERHAREPQRKQLFFQHPPVVQVAPCHRVPPPLQQLQRLQNGIVKRFVIKNFDDKPQITDYRIKILPFRNFPRLFPTARLIPRDSIP